LFIDGNHENFELLNRLPTVDMFGGKVRKISQKVYHLMRGQVYTIENKSFFTLGGATSHDKQRRKEGLNWWREELPTERELEKATANLEAVNWKVDCVITHCAPSSLQGFLNCGYEADPLTNYLDEVKARLSYKKWFFGHYHKDCALDEKHRAVFDDVIPLLL